MNQEHEQSQPGSATYKWEWQSDFAKKYVEEGRKEGHRKGRVKSLLTVITTRGITLTEEQHERIRTCTDADQLTTWIQRAATATTDDDIFD